jgi:hypothetical protein
LLNWKWRQSSPDRKIGLRIEEEAAMDKIGRSRSLEQKGDGQLRLSLKVLAREALWDTVVILGLAFVEEEMEGQGGALRGPRYAHLIERQALRSGLCRVRWDWAAGG